MKKILIVDDDITTIRPLAEDLEFTFGFKVVHLESAKYVIDTLIGSRFDLLILDIMMPIPDNWSFDDTRRSVNGLSTGEVLYEKIRKEFSELPILIYSAKPIVFKIDNKTIILRKPELHSEIVNRINKLISNEK